MGPPILVLSGLIIPHKVSVSRLSTPRSRRSPRDSKISAQPSGLQELGAALGPTRFTVTMGNCDGLLVRDRFGEIKSQQRIHANISHEC